MMSLDNSALSRLGYRYPLQARPEPRTPDMESVLGLGSSATWPRQGSTADLAVVSVCSVNHLHFARTLFESVRRFHPEADLYLAVADLPEGEPVQIPGVRIASARELDPSDFSYKALKFSAYEFCCALKPYAISALISKGYKKLVYVDTDMRLFAPMTALLEALDKHSFVVTPHLRAPFPRPERFWERPSLGDLAYAGPLNAGIFGLRDAAEGAEFMKTWERMVTEPGACMPSLGGQMEQNAFNWLPCFAPHVFFLQDPAYNAAYWNLHERSLRWRGLDGPVEGAEFTIDGKPLVIFHFSGFSPLEPLRLSRHDRRHWLHVLPSITRLFTDYAEHLLRHGALENSRIKYGFDSFPSGIKIDDRMRLLFKEHETQLRVDVDPWTEEGERVYCEGLLSPVASRGSLLPLLHQHIYESRADLRALFPDAPTRPQALMDWFKINAPGEYEYGPLYDTHRPTLPNGPVAEEFAGRLGKRAAVLEGLERPLTRDRAVLARRLATSSPSEIEKSIVRYDAEHYFLTPMHYIWQLYSIRSDLQVAFPDPLCADAPLFIEWLRTSGAAEHFITEHCIEVFRRCMNGRALAKLFSFTNRTWWLMERWPLGFVGEGADEFAKALLGVLGFGLEYDIDDIVTYLWTMASRPWVGIPYVFELAVNLRKIPSPRLRHGQEALLGGLLAGGPAWRSALKQYQATYCDGPDYEALATIIHQHQKSESRPVAVADYLGAVSAREDQARPLPLKQPGAKRRPNGANVFGYFKSPIGLGTLSRGLSLALRDAQLEVRENVVGNVAMFDAIHESDMVQRFDHRMEANVFVSYPHLPEALLSTVPGWMVSGKLNIAYLAWEQREGNEIWARIYRDFDQVWAISAFSAKGLEQCLQREVKALPCVVDFAALPARAEKKTLGLSSDKFVFLTVFDANSSIERKNPEAVVRAFEMAFPDKDDVQLVVRVSNWWRLDHRERLRSFFQVMRRLGRRARLVTAPLNHDQVLGLISAADCFVSLHRAEGFGYTCAEAMAFARPVIATRYSGNLDFMTDADSYLVDIDEVEVAVPDGPFQRGSVWAEPRVEHAAAFMRDAYSKREESAARGKLAAENVRHILSPEAIGRRLVQHMTS